jgi:hypothetical protein
MRTCHRCGGAIAEPNEVTGWAGKWCSCGWESSKPIMPIQSPEEHMERRKGPFMPTFTEEMKDKTATKSRLVRIINLCDELSARELQALINLLLMIDNKS